MEFSSPVGLGDKAKDRITGFTGIVTGVLFLLSGERIIITPQGMHDGEPIDSHSFDVEMIEVIEKNTIQPKAFRDVTSDNRLGERRAEKEAWKSHGKGIPSWVKPGTKIRNLKTKKETTIHGTKPQGEPKNVELLRPDDSTYEVSVNDLVSSYEPVGSAN